MRHLFIINPVAGKKSTNAQLEKLLSQVSFPYETVYTTGEGHAEQLARAAAEQGEPVRIYACGGDGTLNEVVNGAAGYEHVAVTCVPKGTGNDFLKVFGRDYRKIFYDLEALAAGEQRAFDLMDCNGRLGIDVVCAGLDARVAAGVHRYKDWFLTHGMGAYCLSLVENVLKGMSQHMRVSVNGQRWEGDALLLCICNGRHYGGGFVPMPEAVPDDGVLDMLLVPRASLFTFVRLVGDYARGMYQKHPDLFLPYHGQEICYSSDEEIISVVDGEVMRGREFAVRLSEKRVNFFFPTGANYSPEIRAGIGTLESQL